MKKKKIASWLVRGVSSEFSGLDLGDKRLDKRVEVIADALGKNPGLSFPMALRTESALEAAYRVFANERVGSEALLESHAEATRKRAERETEVLVLQDTTSFRFEGAGREGLGWLHESNKVLQSHFFHAHVALCVSSGNAGVPLGVVGMRTFTRKEPARKDRPYKSAALHPDRESARWGKLALEVEARLQGVRVVHVMDRESDQYELLEAFQKRGSHFVIRMHHDRLLDTDEEMRAFECVEMTSGVCEREVRLSRRTHKKSSRSSKTHPPRLARLAQLSFSATQVTFQRPKNGPKKNGATLTVNVVRVWEPEPPPNESPVEWKLLTSEPVESPEDIIEIVDKYRRRWLIEEYFKALKSGCAFQKRQLESLSALEKALALFLPIAWRLLLLRDLSRAVPAAPANFLLTSEQLKILNAISEKPLPDVPTVENVAYALARLGGHLKRNGPPGWQTLGQGFRTLLQAEIGWMAYQNRCDQ